MIDPNVIIDWLIVVLGAVFVVAIALAAGTDLYYAWFS